LLQARVFFIFLKKKFLSDTAKADFAVFSIKVRQKSVFLQFGQDHFKAKNQQKVLISL
jgi:hypothetical protein